MSSNTEDELRNTLHLDILHDTNVSDHHIDELVSLIQARESTLKAEYDKDIEEAERFNYELGYKTAVNELSAKHEEKVRQADKRLSDLKSYIEAYEADTSSGQRILDYIEKLPFAEHIAELNTPEKETE